MPRYLVVLRVSEMRGQPYGHQTMVVSMPANNFEGALIKTKIVLVDRVHATVIAIYEEREAMLDGVFDQLKPHFSNVLEREFKDELEEDWK